MTGPSHKSHRLRCSSSIQARRASLDDRAGDINTIFTHVVAPFLLRYSVEWSSSDDSPIIVAYHLQELARYTGTTRISCPHSERPVCHNHSHLSCSELIQYLLSSRLHPSALLPPYRASTSSAIHVRLAGTVLPHRRGRSSVKDCICCTLRDDGRSTSAP